MSSSDSTSSPQTNTTITAHFDFLVIGAGSGGVRASRVAASLGAKTAVIESRYLGGTCVNVGCVPKKLYVYGSAFSELFTASQGFGWQLENSTFDWNTLRDNKKSEIKRLNGIYDNLLTKAGVTEIFGHAKFVTSNTVQVGDQYYSADHILIATGGWPFVPEFPGSEFAVTSNDIFDLDTLPEKIVIYGGGYIAVEFAGIFNGLGVETHLIYRRDKLLRGFDENVRDHIGEEIAKKGVHIHFETEISAIQKQDNLLVVSLSSGDTLKVDQVMAATGRVACTENLGLENTQVTLDDQGFIQVGDDFKTDDSHIYAVGDVTGGKELTPIAIAEGSALANSLFGHPTSVDYDNIPTAVFCQPNIGTVGVTETTARKKFKAIRVYETRFKALKHTLSGLNEKTYMKLIVDDASDRVVGCHIVGEDAGEIIQGVAIAMKAGAKKSDFDNTIGIHPTAAEELVTFREISRR